MTARSNESSLTDSESDTEAPLIIALEALCGPCQRVFRFAKDTDIDVTHHRNAQSCRQALQARCWLCCFVLMKVSLVKDEETVPKKTWLSVFKAKGPSSYKIAGGEIDLLFVARNSQSDTHQTSLLMIPWEAMSKYTFPVLLSQNTSSASAIAFLLQAYKDCKENHHSCGRSGIVTQYYPTRVVDVGHEGESHICLRDTRQFEPAGPYFCLSHCWGEVQPYTLTNHTFESLQNGWPISSLPKTFRDAISVTRKFRVRYIWIDSLCIFQDRIDDWATEASRMKDVYSQAACVIAATAARNSNEGLFFERNPETLRPCCFKPGNSAAVTFEVGNHDKDLHSQTYWLDHGSPWTDYVENSPLNKRAWVAQERHLAPRIMHFTNSQLFWECYETKASENFPKGIPEWPDPQWLDDRTQLKEALAVFRKLRCSTSMENMTRDLYLDWLKFRASYSQCKMSREEDKLVAIAGIAQDFGETVEDELVAGLWKNRILEELCWTKIPINRSVLSVWRAPTWSWASTDDPIWVSNTARSHNHCTCKEIWPELISLDIESKASGALIGASISIKCKPMLSHMIFKYESNSARKSIVLETTQLTLEWGTEAGVVWNLDDDYDDEEDYQPTGAITLFIIQRCPHEENNQDQNLTSDTIEGLILE